MPRRKGVEQRLKKIGRLRAVIGAQGGFLSQDLVRRPAAPSDAEPSYEPMFAHWEAELAIVERELGEAEDAYSIARDRRRGAAERLWPAAPRAAHRECRARAGARGALAVGSGGEGVGGFRGGARGRGAGVG
ncbi:MAG: hypothetical protein GY719_01365 [bacterium]|nr:hypothetical protein [bacterium]